MLVDIETEAEDEGRKTSSSIQRPRAISKLSVAMILGTVGVVVCVVIVVILGSSGEYESSKKNYRKKTCVEERDEPFVSAQATDSAVLETFSSCDALASELKSGSCEWYRNYWQRDFDPMDDMMEGDMAVAATSKSSATGPATPPTGGTVPTSSVGDWRAVANFSETNNQVKGVDEADIVKTDGRYVYYVTTPSGWYWRPNGAKLVIANAWPHTELKVLSTTEVGERYGVEPLDIFVDGDRLAVIGTSNHEVSLASRPATNGRRRLRRQEESGAAFATVSLWARKLMSYVDRVYDDNHPPPPPPTSYRFSSVAVLLFDVADRTKAPTLLRRIDHEGQYVAARKVKQKVSLVVKSWPRYYVQEKQAGFDELDIMPLTRDLIYGLVRTSPTAAKEFAANGASLPAMGHKAAESDSASFDDAPFGASLSCSSVGHAATVRSQSLTTVVYISVGEGDDAQEVEFAVFAGSGSSVFASRNAVYVAGSSWSRSGKTTTTVAAVATDHRAETGKSLRFAGTLEFPGRLLSQWSLDEFDGYFRAATTAPQSWGEEQRESYSSVFVFDLAPLFGWGDAFTSVNEVATLTEPIAKLEGLAPGERIFAARFEGTKLYLVTFKNTDPLFVIDLAEPSEPKVMGALKIPGYSEYLHPVNATHIVGLGKDVHLLYHRGCDGCEPSVIPTSLKLSLFDVTNFSDPLELYTLSIGDMGTHSQCQHRIPGTQQTLAAAWLTATPSCKTRIGFDYALLVMELQARRSMTTAPLLFLAASYRQKTR